MKSGPKPGRSFGDKFAPRPPVKFAYTVPSREEILAVLRASSTILTAEGAADAMSIKLEERDGFFKRLNAMERDAQVHIDAKGLVHPAAASSFTAGRVQAHRDGFGFLVPDDGSDDLFLSHQEMSKIMHGDRVLARVTGQDRRGRPEGHVVEITERAIKRVIGRVINENGTYVVAPEDKRIGRDVMIAPGGLNGAKAGQIVSLEITDYPSRHSQASGKIVEVLGEVDDPGMEIEIAVRKYGVPHLFSDAALAQSSRLPDDVQGHDLHDRVDLRDVPLVTIDGEDARDFDDAVYCEPIKIGRVNGFRLLVAIADVSHYVRPGAALDADAIERSTSVYFPRRVIPMLPEKLSNGLCSLNPDVDRCVLTCDMIITAKGEVKAYQFYPAVIHSAARLTYNEVAAALSNTKGPEAAKRAAVLPQLQNLYAVYRALLEARQQRGAIDFETTETYIVCNPQGKIEQIIPRTRNDAHKLIEECMLSANVCAADFLKRNKHPGLYRVHGGPNAEKLENLRTFLRGVGLTLNGGDTPHASDFASLILQIKQRPDAPMLQTMLLRSMQQAVYSPENVGHFGLAYEAYAHFTSPIRRYPDLLTHRAIKAILEGRKYVPDAGDVALNTAMSMKVRKQKPGAKASEANDAAKKPKGANVAIWESLGLHCSSNERRADEASRDVEAWLKCYFMRDKLGEEFGGSISGVAPFGVFVTLDSLFVEGLVHVSELGSDYFEYDEVRNELRGERTGIRYGLTDRVRVQVGRVDLDARKMDFRLIRDTPDAGGPAGKMGGRNKTGKAGKGGKGGGNGHAGNGGARIDSAVVATGNVQVLTSPVTSPIASSPVATATLPTPAMRSQRVEQVEQVAPITAAAPAPVVAVARPVVASAPDVAPAKKAAVKKTAAKKAAVVEKAVAKKAPAEKVAAKKAAVVEKASAKKVAAKAVDQVSAKKAAKKVVAADKVPAKKAAKTGEKRAAKGAVEAPVPTAKGAKAPAAAKKATRGRARQGSADGDLFADLDAPASGSTSARGGAALGAGDGLAVHPKSAPAKRSRAKRTV
ncbi:ribonuclease R [Robbsia andropogonis]|uniref:ribonuclease R n=1 Tax=Robbsia andropogonis TaxID=28092 RepID=UPI00389AD316